ncbi:hypothetical protein HDU79_007221 [Rhizoclosmatium sp. JEL0117]|nr:hypothetical protein HDU79_007221 [Rhizoclosmatium sp. JEL0117]
MNTGTMTTQHQTVATSSTEYKICLRFNPIVSVRVFGFAVINEVDCETFDDIEANLAEEDAIEVPAVTEAEKTWFLKYNVRELISSVKGLVGGAEGGIFLAFLLGESILCNATAVSKTASVIVSLVTAKCVSLEQVTTALCQLAVALDDHALDVPYAYKYFGIIYGTLMGAYDIFNLEKLYEVLHGSEPTATKPAASTILAQVLVTIREKESEKEMMRIFENDTFDSRQFWPSTKRSNVTIAVWRAENQLACLKIPITENEEATEDLTIVEFDERPEEFDTLNTLSHNIITVTSPFSHQLKPVGVSIISDLQTCNTSHAKSNQDMNKTSDDTSINPCKCSTKLQEFFAFKRKSINGNSSNTKLTMAPEVVKSGDDRNNVQPKRWFTNIKENKHETILPRVSMWKKMANVFRGWGCGSTSDGC